MKPAHALMLLLGGTALIALLQELTDRQDVTEGQWTAFLDQHNELLRPERP